LKHYIFIIFTSFISYSCSLELIESKKITNPIPYRVVKIFPHDDEAFTQGLVIHNERVLESTGLNNSYIAEVELETGQQNKKVELGKKYFGEGIPAHLERQYRVYL
jgi:glutamine cyclotransferase